MLVTESNVFEFLGNSRSHERKLAQRWLDNRDLYSCVNFLLEIISSCRNSDVKALAIIQLRRRLEQFSAREYEKNQEIFFEFIQKQLAPRILNIYKHEEDQNIQFRIIPLVGYIAETYAAQGIESENLLSYILDLIRGNLEEKRMQCLQRKHCSTALFLLTGLIKYYGNLLDLECRIQDILLSLLEFLKIQTNLTEIKWILQFLIVLNGGSCSVFLMGQKKKKQNDCVDIVDDQQKHPSQERLLRHGKLVDQLLNAAVECAATAFKQFVCSSKNTLDDEFLDILSLIDQLFEVDESIFVESLDDIQQIALLVVKHSKFGYECKQLGLRLFFFSLKSIISPKPLHSNVAECLKDEALLSRVLQDLVNLFIHLIQNQDSDWTDSDDLTQLVEIDSQTSLTMVTGSLLENFIQLLCHFLSHCDSSVLNFKIIKELSLERLFEKNLSSLVRIGSHVVCMLVEERPDLIQPNLLSLLHSLFECLNQIRWNDAKGSLWWLLRAQSSLINCFQDAALCVIPLETILKIFVMILENCRDSPIRSEIFKSLYIIYSSQHALTLYDTKLKQVVPSVINQMVKNDFLMASTLSHPLILRLLTLFITLDSKALKYHEEFLSYIRSILVPKLQMDEHYWSDSSSRERREAAVDLSVELFKKKPDAQIMHHLRWLVEYILETLHFFFSQVLKGLHHTNSSYVRKEDKDEICSLLNTLSDLCILMGEEFVNYCSRFVALFNEAINLSYEVVLESNSFPDGPLEHCSENHECLETLARRIRNSIDEEKWNFILQDEGVQQFVFVGEKMEPFHVFQMNHNTIEIKVKVLRCLKTALDLYPNAFCFFLLNNIPQIICEALCGHTDLYQAALDVLSSVLTTFLPDSREENVCYSDSMCPLRRRSVSLDIWIHMAQSLTIPLINRTSTFARPEECLVYLRSLQYTLEAFQEGIELQSSLIPLEISSRIIETFLENDTSLWLESFFNLYESVLVSTLSRQLQDSEIEESHLIHCEAQGAEQVISSEQSFKNTVMDWEGAIYETVMLGVVALLKVFSEKCAVYSFQHLDPAYMSLLMLPQVNMKGRVAALLYYSALIRYSPMNIQHKLSETILPICLLYVRPNQRSNTFHQLTGNSTQQDDVENTTAEDVYRIHAAAYGIGVISYFVPGIFRKYIDISLKSLCTILAQPHSRSPQRQLAAEGCVAALLKIYLNQSYLEKCRPLQLTKAQQYPYYHTLIELINNWFPFQFDQNGSCEIIDLLISDILNTVSSQYSFFRTWFHEQDKNHPLISALANAFSLVKERYLRNDWLGINKQSWTEGKFSNALDLLHSHCA